MGEILTIPLEVPFLRLSIDQGRTANLRVPEDLDHFCSTPDIPLVDLPDWFSDFRLPHSTEQHLWTDEAGNFRIRRHHTHHPPPPHSPQKASEVPRNASPTASPHTTGNVSIDQVKLIYPVIYMTLEMYLSQCT